MENIKDPKLRAILAKHPGAAKLATSRDPSEGIIDSSRPADEQLLEQVLAQAGDNKKEVEDAVEKAIRGVADKATRTYLRHNLIRRAVARIQEARRKAAA